MYGNTYGYYPGYSYGGTEWIWILVVIFIIFFLFYGNNGCHNQGRGC